MLTPAPFSGLWINVYSFDHYISGKIEKNIVFWPIPIFRPMWAKWIVLTPPPCFVLCSVSGQRVVLGISIPTPPGVDLLSSMTNQLNGCPQFFVSVSYSFFLKLIVTCRSCVTYLEKDNEITAVWPSCYGYTRIIYIYIYIHIMPLN